MTRDDEISFPEGCREISGFGGSYEAACRMMVIAGIRWIEAHPSANLVYNGYYSDNSTDMQKLEKHILELVPDCSGAMLGASLSHIIFAYKHGWAGYIAELQKSNR